MSKKNHSPGPVPPGNRSNGGRDEPSEQSNEQSPSDEGAGFQEQDPKRRLGNFTGAGEHSIQEPGGKQGANH